MSLGKVYIYPTDTVWGIGGDIFDETTYQQISSIKKTKEDKPLSVLFKSVKHLKDFFEVECWTEETLISFFKEGATLGVPLKWAKKDLPHWVSCGSDYLFIRVIDNSFIKELIDEVGGPISTTSLNITGTPPCVNFDEAILFQREYAEDAILRNDEKISLSGLSSTIVQLHEDLTHTIIRKGENFDKIKEYIKLLST